jgi:signal transduction histidine kinase
MVKMLKWFLHLNRLGVSQDSEDEISRRIMFSNVIFISLPIVYFLFMIIDYESYLQPITKLRFDQFIVPIVIAVCIFCLWLNKIKQIIISRILFIVCWPFLLHIIPIYLLKTPSDYYLAFPMGIVFHSMLIQLMFSYRKEAALFWIFLGLNFVMMLSVSKILTYFSADPTLMKKITDNVYYSLDGIMYWFLFNLVTFYIFHIMKMYIEEINRDKSLIEHQKEELSVLNESLEKIVSQRTSELEEQNKKLTEYAFFNAHLLRGPFCRVKGLISLQEMIGDYETEKVHIRNKLNDSIEELDTVIREIQHIVRTES